MKNMDKVADQRRTTVPDGRRLRRRMAFGPSNTWLDKRRDGRSPCWMVAWYDPTVRTVRYKSTRKTKLADAKDVLAKFQLPENAIALAPIERRGKCCVYFIGGDTGPVKIGMAKQPYRRLAELQAYSPVKLHLLAKGIGGPKVERHYHARFASARLHGEWFERNPEINAEIAALQGVG